MIEREVVGADARTRGGGAKTSMVALVNLNGLHNLEGQPC
jgi:hypothetical protein